MGLRERLHDLAKTPVEHQADSLREQSETAGGDDLTALAPRYPATVCGTVRTVTLPPRRSVPALVAEVWDGNGSVNLVWIGRRTIGRHRARGLPAGQRPGRGGARHPDDLQPVLRDRAHHVTEEPTAAGAAVATPETVEALIRHRLATALGGWRGSVETALPTVVFVVFWTWQQDVKIAAGAALGVAVVLAVVRVVQHSSLWHVAGAVFATAIAAFFAVRSGRAEAAFLPGILTNAAFLAATLLSVVTRWPAVGFIVGAGDPRAQEDPFSWRRDRGMVASAPG